MKNALPLFFSMLFASFLAFGQKTPTAYTLETVPDSLCYRFGKSLEHPENYIAAKLTAEELPKWKASNIEKFLGQFTNLELLRITGRKELDFERIIYTDKIVNLTEFETDRFLLEIPYKATTTFIKNNPNLRVLRFATSIDTIPESIGSLQHLEVLEITANQEKTKPLYLPQSIQQLTQLHTLVLALNKTNLGKDHAIWKLPKLENLSISGAGYLEWPVLPATLKRLQIQSIQTMTMGEFPANNQLQYLDITYRGKNKPMTLPVSFENLTQLKGLQWNSFWADRTPNFNQFKELTFLSWSFEGDYDSTLTINLPKLEYLSFSSASDANLNRLPVVITSNLKYLNTHIFNLKYFPEEVYKSSSLVYLNFISFSFSESELIRLLNSPIQYLNIYRTDLSPKNQKKYDQRILKANIPHDYVPPPLKAFEEQFGFQFM